MQRDEIMHALTALGEELARVGVTADRVVPERLLTSQVRFFVEAVLDTG